MFKQSDILDERKGNILRKKSLEVKFPMDPKEKELMHNMIMY